MDNKNISTDNDKKIKWFDSSWVTFFISVFLAKIVNIIWLTNINFIILLPIIMLLVNFSIGGWINKYSNQDIFGRDKK